MLFRSASDKWGRPATKWTYNTGDKATTFVEKPDLTYTKAVAECDVAHDAGLKADKAYTLVVNGQTASIKYPVNLTDTKTKMGAQGRLFEVYDDTIVMIDTFLAKVTYVADMTYDAQGHLKTPATITLEVYDAANGGHTALTLTDKDANYGYAKGDYVLVNAYTTDAAADVSVTTSKQVDNTTNKKYAEIVSKATSVDGAQSVIYWNAQQHNVEGTVYDDATKFYLDNAKQDNGKYTWFFDQYGNLIGNVEIAAATSYGVITKLWWAGNAADGSGVAKADVTYMDGTTGQIDISEMIYDDDKGVAGAYNSAYGVVTHSSTTATNKLMQADAANLFYVDPYATENARTTVDTNSIVNGHLFQFITKSNGTVKAMEVSGNGAAISVKDQNNNVVASVDARVFNSVQVAVTKNTQVYGGGGTDPRMVVNDNTLFLIRTATTTAGVYTYSSVKGFTNVGSYTNDNKVDYVDLNKDGVADYVYITSPSATSKVTSVFYFDDAQGAYTLSDGTWVVPGYVDGVAGSIKFANYAALTTLIMNADNTKAVTLTANTLYIVALEDGVVRQGHVVAAAGETLDAENVGGTDYKLAAAYDKYPANTVKVAYVEGNAGTSANNFADRDTFDGSLYTDTGATITDNVYYSVITTANDVTKVIGTMGNPTEQNYFFVYVDSSNAENNRLAVQAYAYDKVKGGNALDAATVIGVALNANKSATVSLNNNNDAKQGDVYSVTLEQLRDNGYVTVGTFSDKVLKDGDNSVTIDLKGVIGAGTYKVTAGSYTSIMSFAN